MMVGSGESWAPGSDEIHLISNDFYDISPSRHYCLSLRHALGPILLVTSYIQMLSQMQGEEDGGVDGNRLHHLIRISISYPWVEPKSAHKRYHFLRNESHREAG